MTDDDAPAVVIDVDLARRLAKIVKYAVNCEQVFGWEGLGWKRTANELRDAMIVAGAES